MSTASGKQLLARQTERLAASLLPGDFSIALGEQDFGFTFASGFAFDVKNVVLSDRGSGETVVAIDSLQSGVGLLDLLTGDLALGHLTLSGLRIDAERLPRGGEFPPLDATAVFAAVDAGARRIAALPVDFIELADLRVLGDDHAALPRLVRAVVEKPAQDEIRFDVALDVSGEIVEAVGDLALAENRKTVSRLDLATNAMSFAMPSDDTWDGKTVETRTTVSLSTENDQRILRFDTDAALLGGERGDHDPRLEAKLASYMREDDQAFVSDITITDEATFRGRFTASVDLASTTGTYPVSLRSRELVSAVGSRDGSNGSDVARAADFAASGTFDPRAMRLSFPDIALEMASGSVNGRAEIRDDAHGGALSTKFRATGVSAADLKAFWPFFLVDGPREWVFDNLLAGQVGSATFDLAMTLPRLAAIVVPGVEPEADEVRLALDFGQGHFRTVGEMPALTEVKGTIRYAGGQTEIAVETASVEGMTGLSVLPSTLGFRSEAEAVAASLSLGLEGEASAILSLLGHEPVDRLNELEVGPEDVAGRARVKLDAGFRLSREPRERDFLSDAIEDWSVVAELDGVDIRKPIRGHRLGRLTGLAVIAPGNAMGELSAHIDGLPATINFSRPLAPEPVGEPSLKISARIESGMLAEVSPVLADFVSGPLDVELTQTDAGFAAEVDLGAAAMRLPPIGWSKSAGIPARLTFDVLRTGSRTRINDAVLEGEGFSARGRARLDEAGLETLVLESLSLNPGDAVSARLSRIEGGLGLSVAGTSIDARPVISALRDRFGDDDPASGPSSSKSRLIVELSAQRLLGFNGETMQNVELRYEERDDRIRAASLTANLERGEVTGFIGPADDGTASVDATIADTGAFLRFAGLYEHMRGGQAGIRLRGRDGGFAGSFRVRNFSLVGEERLRSLVGTGNYASDSLAGRLGRDLPVANAFFETARARLFWRDGRLVVENGILRGPIFGSSFEGTLIDAASRIAINGSFMPAYGVNRIFGALPLVGNVLGNGIEGGLIGITYRLEGAFSDPTLTVNPISLIAPGIFRRIFEY
ncbi:AsmA-like C-terminal region-containing protein [Jiella marina]|uniref:AsmA-like C-terminal region-containing protein n=1 Tax=Jiella sp. LLJ827 TaxID=2917712 RepID=UPI0021011EAB|nr:AsmA-like C-terminal region-containing protein [Jiella sp. LLJ827]MCQ0986187.1 AsmA-like C-terminal region-containing protein [Jiella sp. LLJ827]